MSFVYGGVELKPVKTNSWRQEAVYSEDGVQPTGVVRHFIDVECLYNPKATASAPGALPPETNAGIRAALMQPRGLLQWDLGGHTFLTSPAAGTPCDAEGGPFPLECVITQVCGVRTWRVRFLIKTALSACPPGQAPLVLSNQYSDSHAIDDQFRTTITHRGRAVFDLGQLESAGTVADRFRAELIPPVLPGFKRETINIQAHSNRYVYDWTAVDREQFVNLGDTQRSQSYITKCEFDFSAVTAMPDPSAGGKPPHPIEVVNVKLWGDKRASDFVMMQRAFELALNKVPYDEPGNGYIQQISVAQALTQRFVQVQIVYLVAPTEGAQRFLGLRVDDLRKDPDAVFPPAFPGGTAGDNPYPPWGKGTRGTYAGVIDLNALKQACLEPPSPPVIDAEDDDDGDPVAGVPDNVTVTEVDDLPPYESAVAPTTAPYTDAQVEITRKRKEGVLMVPNASGPQKGHTDDRGNWVPDTPGPSASFFRIHQPIVTYDVAYTLERLNEPPLVPHPVSQDPNLVLLDSEVTPLATPLMVDGNTQVWRVTGFIKWGCKRAPTADAPFFVGLLPWTTLGPEEVTFPSENFVTGMVDREDGTAPGGGPVGAAV